MRNRSRFRRFDRLKKQVITKNKQVFTQKTKSRYTIDSIWKNMKNEIIIFKTKDGGIKVEVNLQKETVWLNLNQM